jgi:hypothetical protein
LRAAKAKDLAILSGALGCAFMIAVVSATVTVPLLPSNHPTTGALVNYCLPIFDEAVATTIALSGVAAIAAISARGMAGLLPFGWFIMQALVAWGCYQLRRRSMPA